MKKIKILNWILIITLTILGICELVKIITTNGDRLATCLVLFPILYFPWFLRKVGKIEINPVLELIYLIFVALAQFLGSVINLYNKVWWYDLFSHTISGWLTSLLALFFLVRMNHYQEKHLVFNITYILGIGLLVAGLWEFFEYGSDVLTGSNLQHAIETGVKDTMDDMLVAFVGSIIFCVSYSYEILNNKKYVIRKLVDTMKK